ncbi:hypothetical protein L596_020952 [Steinernema carpocapsae]|uniref:7TM GPCR serpentine receptor class x (Srx) domain-containing protein n=1 Tax=Steinernema carpocapsae TaxID=34508 RepID=A0A4U5MV02_STECR|nr:hypothetical protein L596_020952 [Steinernema carpocapsae]
MAMAWGYGITHSVILLTPLAKISYIPETFTPKYDYGAPHTLLLQEISAVYNWVVSFVTFVMYVAIAVSVVWQHRSSGGSASFKQSWIIVQAAIRFVCDLFITLLFHLGPIIFTPMLWLSIFIGSGYIISNVILPPVLYVVLHKYVMLT